MELLKILDVKFKDAVVVRLNTRFYKEELVDSEGFVAQDYNRSISIS